MHLASVLGVCGCASCQTAVGARGFECAAVLIEPDFPSWSYRSFAVLFVIRSLMISFFAEKDMDENGERSTELCFIEHRA